MSNRHWYKKFPGEDPWLVDFCVAYANAHRNHEYIHLLIAFAKALLAAVNKPIRD